MKNLAIAYAAKRASRKQNEFLTEDMDTPFEAQPYENESEMDSGSLDNEMGNEDQSSLRSKMVAEIMRKKMRK